MQKLRSIVWERPFAKIIDQTKLPNELEFKYLRSLEDYEEAIVQMRVRGAPLIGVTAAYGMATVAIEAAERQDIDFKDAISVAAERLKKTRPTAINLFKAIDRVISAIQEAETPGEAARLAEAEAKRIDREEVEMCEAMAANGLKVLKDRMRVLTICNTGFLATSGIGTALGVIYRGFEAGKIDFVYACETRPVLQGARLTMWELLQAGIPSALITDNTAGLLMAKGLVDGVFVGADRIAANGDTANKIGTLTLAVLAKHFGIPFYVVAPSSSIDPSIPDGNSIPIEERPPDEVLDIRGCRIAPRGANALNFAFDVTPSELITGIITERGIIQPNEISRLF